MRFASLGSGSRGNALIVEAGATRLLVDCGFGPCSLTERLGRLGLTPDELDGVLVTHEHSDHVAGLMPLARRHCVDVYLTHGTLCSIVTGGATVQVIDSQLPFSVRDVEISPFPVPHDAREPVQFVLGDGLRRLGVLTDAGWATPHMVEMLNRCEALIIECNHDLAMLDRGGYPAHLKRRIAGHLGHLDNTAAAELLRRLDRSRLQHVVAAHLSQHNNTPKLARAALAEALCCQDYWIGVAEQDSGCAWRQLD